jgi:hypothetical protein
MVDHQLQLEAAETLQARFKRDTVPIRNSFIARGDNEPLPPLAQIVRSGRGWDARLRTYLTLLWGSIPPTYTLSLGAAAYAKAAGIPSARQVRSSISALVDLHLMEVVDDSPGRPFTLRPLHESGRGSRYTAPSELRPAEGRRGRSDLYIRIPVGLWVEGWIAALSGPALATLLIYTQMKASQARDRKDDAVWLSLDLAVKRFGVSEDTRYRGLKELKELGVVTVETKGHSKPPYKRTRRQMVTLNLERLDSAPETED